MDRRIRIARGLLTFTALFLAIVPPTADLNASHIFHPEWPGHARLHTVWLLVSNSLVSLLAVYWMWRPRTEDLSRAIRHSAVLVSLVLAGFFVAAGTQSLYGGALTDVGGIALQVGSIDANLAAFSVHACIVGAALYLLRSSTD